MQANQPSEISRLSILGAPGRLGGLHMKDEVELDEINSLNKTNKPRKVDDSNKTSKKDDSNLHLRRIISMSQEDTI